MLIHPLIEGAGDDLLGIVFEIMERGDIWVAGKLRAFCTDLLKQPEVLGVVLVIGAIAEAAQ